MGQNKGVALKDRHDGEKKEAQNLAEIKRWIIKEREEN
jgi:hypothetical protein